jgi:acetyl esterase/lipase
VKFRKILPCLLGFEKTVHRRPNHLEVQKANFGSITFMTVINHIIALVLAVAFVVGAQGPAERLWPSLAPGSIGSSATDTVNNPYLIPFPSQRSLANGTALVLCPGGSYTTLASEKEGTLVAKWLNTLGISAFVLRYRLGNGDTGDGYHHPIQLWDAQRAVRWVKANAARYHIDTSRVGIFGASAGGHLASSVATHYDIGWPIQGSIGYNSNTPDSIDGFSSRPAFQVLLYPVISMDSAVTHPKSRRALLGNSPSDSLVRLLSSEKQVTRQTPPAFIIHSFEDATVSYLNSQYYADALKVNGVPHLYHLYPSWQHGFGLAETKPELATWKGFLVSWLDSLNFLPPPIPLDSSEIQDSVPTSIKRTYYKKMRSSDQPWLVTIRNSDGKARDLQGRTLSARTQKPQTR